MKPFLILLLLQGTIMLVTAEEESKDFDIDNNDDLERRHRKRKKHHNQNPCFGGYGKFFGPETTYISAPVTNYFFGCPGTPAQPPIHEQGVFQHGHHGSHGHGGHGHYGQGHNGYGGQGYYDQEQFGNGYLVDRKHYQRPFQNVAVSAAAALANYITRPKKVQKHINRLFRPLFNLL